MSKKEKQLQAMRNNPQNVRFETLQRIFLDHGFVETSPGGGSSHYTYHKGIYRITVVKDKPVNKIYVKRAIEIIDTIRKSEEEL
ncbi:MAG: toxin HicA [Oscillospiraceae bacterium]|nr:toxin HicA [Oscillospiraceae bacterium]